MFQENKYFVMIVATIFGYTLCSSSELHAETIVRHERTRHESIRVEPKDPFIQSNTNVISPAMNDISKLPPNPDVESDNMDRTPPSTKPNVPPMQSSTTNPQNASSSDDSQSSEIETIYTDETQPQTEIGKPISLQARMSESPTATLQVEKTKSESQPRMESRSFRPMTYEEALRYQQAHNKDIIVSNYNTKDKFGNKNTERIFDFLGKKGFVNSGSSISGISNTSALRLTVSYGFANDPTPPTVTLSWGGDFDGPPDNGYAPTGLNVVFSDGYVKSLDLQGYNYSAQWVTGLLYSSVSHFYSGSILLSPFDIYDMTHHGNVAAAHLTTAYGGMRHLFYSGDKNRKQKEQMTRGLNHIATMMDVNENSISLVADTVEQNRKKALKEEIRSEVLQEQEREKLKAEILEEIRREQNSVE